MQQAENPFDFDCEDACSCRRSNSISDEEWQRSDSLGRREPGGLQTQSSPQSKRHRPAIKSESADHNHLNNWRSAQLRIMQVLTPLPRTLSTGNRPPTEQCSSVFHTKTFQKPPGCSDLELECLDEEQKRAMQTLHTSRPMRSTPQLTGDHADEDKELNTELHRSARYGDVELLLGLCSLPQQSVLHSVEFGSVADDEAHLLPWLLKYTHMVGVD
jgi:hypothetical protein